MFEGLNDKFSWLFEWAPVFQVIALFGVAVVGAVIAHRQWRTAHEKLRLDLFEKRWDVYQKAVDFQNSLAREFKLSPREFAVIGEARARAQYLFGSDINRSLRRMQDLAAHITALSVSIDSPGENTAREKEVERRTVRIGEWLKECDQFALKLNRYLRFDLSTLD